MDNYNTHECGKIGLRTGLLCAGLGVGMACLMLWALRFDVIGMMGLNAELLVGLVVLFISAACLGTKNRPVALRSPEQPRAECAHGYRCSVGLDNAFVSFGFVDPSPANS